MKKLKVALIGTGSWAKQHARILSLRSDIDLCGIAGRHKERTQARADAYKTRAYTSIETLLNEQVPDFVCICLPNQHHFDITLQVIQAGFPLLVEKPLVFNLEEATLLIEEAKKRNLFFAINFNHRYARPLLLAKEAIDQKKLGDIVFASWRFGGEGSSDHPHANLIETQCHAFDQLESLCGPIISVMAEMTNKTGKGFTTVVLSLKFQNGAVGSLLGSYDSSYSYSQTHRLEINGTLGRIVIDDTVQRYTFQVAGQETAQVWQAGYFNDFDREFYRTFDRHMDAMLLAFRAGQQPPIPAQVGQRVLQLAYAAIESYQKGQRIDIPSV